MIKSFAEKETERLFGGRKSKAVPPHLREKALAKLLSVDIATDIHELEAPPSKPLAQAGW